VESGTFGGEQAKDSVKFTGFSGINSLDPRIEAGWVSGTSKYSIKRCWQGRHGGY